MKTKTGMDRVNVENQFNGLAFGLLMGAAFLVGAWGIDTFEMWQVSASLPWLRLVLGIVLVLPLAGLAGWLVARADSALVGLVTWLLVAVGFSYWAGHVPYEMASWVVGWMNPDFQGQQVYPFNASALTRLWISAVVSGVLLAIGGALQTIVVDAARTTNSVLRRFFIFLVCVPFFVAAGIFADLVIQRPLRQPLVVIDDLLQFALDTEGQQVDKTLARTMHLGAVNSIRSLLHQPRSLIMGDYDLESLESARVLVDFNGEWARCWVIAGQPSFCQPSGEFYGVAFQCLWENKVLGGKDCKIKAAEPAQEWFEGWQDQSADLQGWQPEIQVRSQYGVVALLMIKIGRDAYECRFRDAPTLTLETCTPAPRPVEGGSAVPQPAPTPTSQVEAGRGQAEIDSQQAQALLPEAQKDLQDLLPLNQYDIEVKLKQDQTFQGQMEVAYTNSEAAALESVYFRLFPNGGASYGNGSLIASEVKVDDLPAETVLSLSDSVLEVKFPQVLAPGGEARIRMDFAGVVPGDYGGEETAAYGIYNYSKRVLALAGWYPILAVYDEEGWNLDPASPVGDSVYSDMALYAVDITTTPDQVLAATGVQVSDRQEGDLVQYRYVSGPARDFFIISSPDFKLKSRVVDGTQVNSYYLTGQEPGGTRWLNVAAEAVQVYNDNFGPYPYTELDIVDAPMRNAGGVEFPGIVLIESSRYDAPESPVFINTVAHEVAHQWWYNIVGNDVIEEPWLDEGLTTFSAGFYFEEAYGSEGYQGAVSYWQQSYDKVIQDGKDDMVTRSLTYFENSADPRAYGPVVYAKGALFFYNLRKEIGDKAFFSALQAYYRQFKYQIATADDLLRAFEDTSGSQLDEFYQKWLYSPVNP